MISSNTRALVAYGFLKGVGKRYLVDFSLSAIASSESAMTHFESYKLKKVNFSEEQLEHAFSRADEQIEIATSFGHHIISMFDDEYPETLKAIKDAPPVLYCAGNLELLGKATVTIIGTREPTLHGEIIAQRITNWFVETGWVIASGLAKGIDTIAHKSCLESNGETISVLAHGLEKVYPAENKPLAQNIVDNSGLLITEYPYKSFVGRSNFVERDRIQAALAKAVILVQSDVVGGSLHASRSALEYGRYLVVVGQSSRDIANSESKISANRLLSEGAPLDRAKLLKTSVDSLSKVLYLPNKQQLQSVNDKIRQLDIRKSNLIGDNINLFN